MPDATRQRLRDFIALLRTHPGGLSAAEIATRLGVSRRTVYKDRDRLSLDGIPIYEENNRLVLDSHYQAELQLSLAQAWLMYLLLRRIVRANLHRFPLVKSLLYRIAALVQPEMADQLVPDSLEEASTERDQVFAELVYCWQEQRHVELRYQRPNAERETHLVLAPWWFEPAVWSDAFYLIGGLYRTDGEYTPLTLKLDRIRSVQALSTRFDRPSGQTITDSLESTWGIWAGEDAPILVKLRFHNRLHQRLNETRWHPTQNMVIDTDGSIIWQARISEPQEMLPWIRSWGADVEVLEPEGIREQIASEAAATARLYGADDAGGEDYIF